MAAPVRSRFLHVNFNVLDLTRSLDFYREALGLTEVRRIETDAFTIVYLGDGETDFLLELTWLKDRKTPYDLGECEYHIAYRVPDRETAHALHERMGCIAFENKEMDLYFITDPDGYWIEILDR